MLGVMTDKDRSQERDRQTDRQTDKDREIERVKDFSGVSVF